MDAEQREAVENTEGFIRVIAGAVMWLLHFVFGLEKDFMLCKPDKFRGEWLLRDIMHGGNFGRHKDKTRLLSEVFRAEYTCTNQIA